MNHSKKMVKESDFYGIGSSYGRNERNADICSFYRSKCKCKA